MTIGSFVCTSCSGILRGLNPPHRVKSISMASFTPDEIEFIRSKGNDYCQHVWLGSYDPRSAHEPEAKDEQRMKDFMANKYERKRWYVEPSVAMKNMLYNNSAGSKTGSTASTPSSTTPTPTIPETRSLSSLVGSSAKPVYGQQQMTGRSSSTGVLRPVGTSVSMSSISSASLAHHHHQPHHPPAAHNMPHHHSSGGLQQISADLFEAHFDPFSSGGNSTSDAASTNSTNFANFDHFNSSGGMASPPASVSPFVAASAVGKGSPVFPTSFNSNVPPPIPPHQHNNKESSNLVNNNAINNNNPSKDRYAALADLDNLYHSQEPALDWAEAPPKPSNGTNGTLTWTANGTKNPANPNPNNVPAVTCNPFSPGATSWMQSNSQNFAAGNPFGTTTTSTGSVPYTGTPSDGGFNAFQQQSPYPVTSPIANGGSGQGYGGGTPVQNGGTPWNNATPWTTGNHVNQQQQVSPGFPAAPAPGKPYSGSWTPSAGNPFLQAGSAPIIRSNPGNPFL